MIYIRFCLAVVFSIVVFLLGWLIYFFCLGAGPAMLAYILFYYYPFIKTGILKDESAEEWYEDAMVWQTLPFEMARHTFTNTLNGFEK